MRCAVKNCKSENKPKKTTGKPPSFHSLPQNEDQRKIWLQRLDIDLNHLNTANIFICDLHFRPEDILKTRKSCKWKTFLRKGALPIEL
uniref:Uncharacterized protein n=1 Tax=Phlebotomus papatasi TaxID=29031 RepID=A0A1B0GMU8_PHLPP